MDVPRFVVLVIILLILFASPDTQSPSASQRRELDYEVTHERYALGLLNTSSYNDFEPTANKWVNVTGLRKHDDYAWDLLPKVQEKASRQRNLLAEAWSRSSLDKHFETPNGNVEIANGTLPKVSNTQDLPFYHNVTGVVRGRWVRSVSKDNTRHPVVNLTALAPRMAYTTERYTRNVTGPEGGMLMRFDEKQSTIVQSGVTPAREITAELTLEDDRSSGDVWRMTLHGIHYPRDGSIILTTTGPRFAGIFALPYFALSPGSFTSAQKLLDMTLDAAINTQERASETNALSPWSSSPERPLDFLMPTPKCEYLVYMQQHPVDAGSIEMEVVEAELRQPTGRRDIRSPPLQMSAIIFSPDCGLVLESKGPPDYAQQYGLHLQGPKLEVYIDSSRRAILALAIVICGEIFLLFRQIREASTPSTKSRISLYTMGMLAMGDGFISFAIFIISLSLNAAFLPLVTTAFLAFFSGGFLGMKFWLDIWTVQGPERERNQRRRQQDGHNPANDPSQAQTMPARNQTVTLAGADTLPLPVTAPRSDRSIVLSTTPDEAQHSVPGDQSTGSPAAGEPPRENAHMGTNRVELSSIYARFYFILVVLLLFTLHSTTWPSPFRTIYIRSLSMLYLSFLTPQVYRNIIRNCRKALQWRFVIGQSILRSLPFAYFYLYRDNVLFVDPDSNWMVALIGWLWFQTCVLVSQELFGSRFLVPRACNRFIAVAYEYHPILREEDEESGGLMPVGFAQANTSATDAVVATSPSERGLSTRKEAGLLKDKRVFDCAICMQSLEVPIVPRDAGSESTSNPTTALSVGVKDWIFGRRAYMVTPCRHIFHSVCLENWMRYRLQCPICRDDLPPL
ncbi:MAG: hypothetical protein Q9168_004968 [Polycauliona sp. 1 TL-2023]